jgi:hypothetical protein
MENRVGTLETKVEQIHLAVCEVQARPHFTLEHIRQLIQEQPVINNVMINHVLMMKKKAT